MQYMRSTQCSFQEFPLVVDGLRLYLRRYAGESAGGRSVLLLHGGNTNSRMYREPNGGLVRFLGERGWDVWTLDWRGSSTVLEPLLEQRCPLGGSVAAERALFTLDRVADADIPEAIHLMREAGRVQGELAVVGFCLGGGALSMALARGALEPFGVRQVVLVTLGLFYEVPWDGWLKAEDFVIERLLADAADCRAIGPKASPCWPDAMHAAYCRWPKAWLGRGKAPLDEMFRRLTFMYGEPYARARLSPEFERSLLEGFFGSLHIGLYQHAGQMVRRGYAARFNEPDVLDRYRPGRPSHRLAGVRGDLSAPCFLNKQVTLLAGAHDRLWHRDSIDLMYEWLRNEISSAGAKTRCIKRVLPDYGHLDLFWSEESRADVYPVIEDAIR